MTRKRMTRKLLHAADIHLDSPLQKLDRYDHAPVDRIRGATRRALENMTQLAIDQEVDLVVIAGDLYDGDWTDQNTGLAFVREASKLIRAGIPLLVIRGNHDAANVMTSSLPLPTNPDGSNVFLASEGPESRFFEDRGIVVHGQSFRTRAEKSNLAAKYPDPIDGLFNLGLLHTGLEGHASHATYAPCTAAELSRKGYDYWALGHIHDRRDESQDGGPPIVFSGNIQGRHIGEQGPKGCVIIDIDERNECEYTFHPLDVLRWHQCEIDVTEMQHIDEINDAYQQWLLDEVASANGRLTVHRVRLIGRSSLHTSLHQQQPSLHAGMQSIGLAMGSDDVWLEDLRIRTELPSDQSVDSQMDGPLESLTHVLQSLRTDENVTEHLETELADLCKKLPRELRGDESEAVFPFSDSQWVGDLIDSAAADMLGRLSGDSVSTISSVQGDNATKSRGKRKPKTARKSAKQPSLIDDAAAEQESGS